MQLPAMLLHEMDVQQQQQQQQQNDDDVHIELLWAQQLLHRDFPGSYSVTAIAVGECGEWRSPDFIVHNHAWNTHLN